MTPYQRIVIKLGTSTLTYGTTHLSFPHLIDLVRQISQLHSNGYQIILVSSGAMAAGKEVLDFPELPKFVPAKQMLAAVGQPHLMAIYNQIFTMYSKIVAQVLLTRFDLADRRGYLNVRNTINALLSHDIIPIVNENDTVATEEIRLGDNDNLSALIANAIEADLLILLTNQPGLFTDDPNKDRNAQLIPIVSTGDIPEEVWHAAGGSSSELGTGGMVTKLQAAQLARRSGATVVIAGGDAENILSRIVNGESVGTFFTPLISKLESRKRYILAGSQTDEGKLIIDPGAANALKHGGSLLPVGISAFEGNFERGDSVSVLLEDTGKMIAQGLVNYASKHLAQICGQQSTEIESILGFTYGDEVLHHNNMMFL